MPNTRQTFQKGIMNRDTDERLLLEGTYRDALNIRVSSSEGSDVGAIENCLGNEQISDLGLTNAKTIGSKEDDVREKIYWWVISDEKEGIVEWDKNNNATPVSWVLECTTGTSVLGLNNGKLINFINFVYADDNIGVLLFWVQEGKPPRMLNIERAKTYGLDGFTEDDISVIKKPPALAPSTQLTYTVSSLENNLEKKILTFAYRYRYLDEMYSALSFFTAYQFAPNEFELDFQTLENLGMINSFNAIDIFFNTGDRRVLGIDLIVKESNSNVPFIIESFDKEEEGWADDTVQSFLFSNNKTYQALSEIQLFRLYDNVPPLANVQEFIGNRLSYYDYYEGYDISDCDGNNIAINYAVDVVSSNILGEVIPSVLSDENATIDTIPFVITDGLLTIDLTGIELSNGKRLIFGIDIEEQTVVEGFFRETFQFILNSDYADANALATSQEFIDFVQTYWSSSFNNNYTLVNQPLNSEIDLISNFEIVGATTTSIVIRTPYVKFEIDNTPADLVDSDFSYEYSLWGYRSQSEVLISESAIASSVKSNRDLEVGLIYYDDANRCTTVLTSKSNTKYISNGLSDQQNKLEITLINEPPCWATKYKFTIKQNRFDYETIYASVFYEEGLYRWVLLEGNNKDKVNEGDTLIVKSDMGGIVSDLIKVKVIEIDNKEKDFLDNNETDSGSLITERSGRYMKIKPTGFDMNYNENTFGLFTASSHLRYPVNTYTSPNFGSSDGSGALGPGSKVRIRIGFSAKGSISYSASYDKEFIVQSNYATIEDWFNTEVVDLGSFGDTYTRDYGFDDAGERFFVRAHRDGTASRKITTTVIFDVIFIEGLVVFETEPKAIDTNIFYEGPDTFLIENGNHLGNTQDQDVNIAMPAICLLNFFNCYVQGNGVESYKVLDGFNENSLNIDTRPNTTSQTKFKRVHRYASITHSEPLEESTNLNGLNEFNIARGNFKDLEKKYGIIQNAFYRDDNILVIQEDKWGQLLYQKDIVTNANGDSSIVAIDSVLGRYIPYAGEYGISRSPESFAYNGNRVYGVDPKRGSPLRLSTDGLTEISMYGLIDFFKDIFRDNTYMVYEATYDPYFDEYLLVISDEKNGAPFTIGFSERNKGWVSRYSFAPEKMVGMNNHLYSFKNGELYIHNSENVPRNNFYGEQYTSKVQLILNTENSEDKIFKNLIQEANIPWEATLETNLTNGTIKQSEFNRRDSKWFAHTRGNEDTNSNHGGATQGIGIIQSFDATVITYNAVSEFVNIGDELYQLNNNISELIGIVEAKTDTTLTFTPVVDSFAPVDGYYSFAKKNARVEGSEIRGYYMDVTLESNTGSKAELFAIQSNIVKSFV